jgi:hypothetical protein
LALTGHRGRVNARGQHLGTRMGLTRTAYPVPTFRFVMDAGAAPKALRMPATPSASPFVRHEKERLSAGLNFASSPAPRDAAGRGH